MFKGSNWEGNRKEEQKQDQGGLKNDGPARPVGVLNDGPRPGGPFTTPKEKPEIFTADEQEIINKIKPINQSMRAGLCIKAEPSRGRKMTLTIVGYGHDAVALSPEPEEGGISQVVYYVYESDISTGMGMESKMEQQVKAVTISSLSSLGFMAPQVGMMHCHRKSKHPKSNMLKTPVAGMVEKATVVLNSVAGVEEGETDIVDEGGISA
ncbi:hypothetical protein Tco_1412741 [Tanacetum coccineum]